MKFSSPSSSSFDSRSNAAAAAADAAAGCLSGILHRILCGSLRSSNSREGEEVDEIDAAFGQEWKVEQKSMRSPGIVARLMGLESMPVCPYAASELIGRSRSTNSLESWPGFLSERSRSPLVGTSLSFREVPTYLRQENEDFLLLSFTPDDKEDSNGMRRRTRFREMKGRKSGDRDRVKRETKSIEEKKKKNRRDEHQCCRKKNVTQKRNDEVKDSAVHSRKKNVRRRGCQGTKAEDLIKPAKHIEMPIMLERSSINTEKRKIENARGKLESECSSQDSSPVSVLDLAYTDDDCCINNNSPTSEEEKQTVQQSSRRKLSSNFENVSCLSPGIGFATFSKDGGIRSFDKESKRSRKPGQPCPDFSDVWENICRLAEEDLKNSARILKEMWRSEGVEEDIAADLGLEIFDQLLCEVVCEFSNNNAL